MDECDIVMKGGITSGVVYPSAMKALAERYRFRSVGGASVGAIAAAVTAAAEYGRLTGRGTGFAQLDVMNEEMAREGFLVSLFRPRAAARGVHAIYLAVTQRQGLLRVVSAVLGQAAWVLVVLLAWLATLVVTAVALGRRWWLVPLFLAGWILVGAVVTWAIARRVGVAGLVAGAVLALLWPLLLAVPAIGVAAFRDLSAGGFGLVPGASTEGDALCDWLHRHIQTAAGLPEDRPLTFGMLRGDATTEGGTTGIDLRMVTTDLSTARPVRVPDDLEGLSFAPADLTDVVPRHVLGWLVERGAPDGELVRLPTTDDVPVLLGFRLSLSFPLLFTGVRLYAPAMETLSSEPRAHWFSDGGIASNFPIHLFDAWVPTRPTFALSFAAFPLDEDGHLLMDETDIGLPPEANGARLPRWVSIDGVGGFAGQILETMQNWRDTVQSELPGSRDRVFEARLDKQAGEGGLNLAMERETIQRLQARGRKVGEAILRNFDWDQHFFTRYLVAMQQLELGLLGTAPGTGRPRRGIGEAFAARADAFARSDVAASELFGHDATWLRSAGAATSALVELAQGWSAFGGYAGDAPRPRGVMRVTPDT